MLINTNNLVNTMNALAKDDEIQQLQSKVADLKNVIVNQGEMITALETKLDKAREALKEIVRVPYTSIKWGTVSARAGEALVELDK